MAEGLQRRIEYSDLKFIRDVYKRQILAGAFIGAGIGALSTTAMKAGEEISTGNVRSAKEAFRDVGISAASGFITGAFGAKFPGAHRLTEGVVDTAVSAEMCIRDSVHPVLLEHGKTYMIQKKFLEITQMQQVKEISCLH